GTPGAFRGGLTYGSSYADFTNSYDPINSYSQGSSGGTYTVRSGDTLQGIAQNVWGDSSLWYKLAEANGLSGGGSLAEGSTLILPGGVVKSAYNAGSVKPYNPAEAIGDLSPTTPAPQSPKKNKCGVFGMILIAVIAIAVTVVTAGAALAAIAPSVGGIASGISTILGTAVLGGTVVSGVGAGLIAAAGVVGAVVGSIVSQGVGVATGIQEKFSWKAVAMAGISGIVSAGVGGIFGKAASAWGAAGQAALSSAITQGIGVATGLQSKFDFAGVAAAAVAAGVGHVVTKELTTTRISPNAAAGADVTSTLSVGAKMLSGAAQTLADAATRSVLTGTSFGDNLIAAVPDTIASFIRDMVAGATVSKFTISQEQLAALVNSNPAATTNRGNGVGATPAVLVTVTDSLTGETLMMDDAGNFVTMPQAQDAAGTPSTGWGDQWNALRTPEARRNSDIPAIRNAQRLLDSTLPKFRAIGVPGQDDGGLPGLMGSSIAPSSQYVKGQIEDLLVRVVIPGELNEGRDFGRQRTLIGEIQKAAYRALNYRQELAFRYFTSPAGGNWSNHAAVAIIASLTQESFMDPGRRQNDYLGAPGAGIGLAQWGIRDSRAALYNSLPGNRGYQLGGNNVKTNALAGQQAFYNQLSFVNYELTNPQSDGARNYVNLGTALRQARTLDSAVSLVVGTYEAPRDTRGETTRRQVVATSIWNDLVARGKIRLPRTI
ncbi:MAG: phage tail tip lysozyme, partial [Pseudomonadota bacterium]